MTALARPVPTHAAPSEVCTPHSAPSPVDATRTLSVPRVVTYLFDSLFPFIKLEIPCFPVQTSELSHAAINQRQTVQHKATDNVNRQGAWLHGGSVSAGERQHPAARVLNSHKQNTSYNFMKLAQLYTRAVLVTPALASGEAGSTVA